MMKNTNDKRKCMLTAVADEHRAMVWEVLHARPVANVRPEEKVNHGPNVGVNDSRVNLGSRYPSPFGHDRPDALYAEALRNPGADDSQEGYHPFSRPEYSWKTI